MNNEEEILFEKIMDLCKISFELRGKMSLIQEKNI